MTRLQCPWCAKTFADPHARYQHARASHDGKSLGAVRPADVSAARDRNVVRKVGEKR